jgi:hypothetical protein
MRKRPLSPDERAILRALSETSGSMSRDIADFVWPDSWDERRLFIDNYLLKLRDEGLIAHADSKRPFLWVRTELGTKALSDE